MKKMRWAALAASTVAAATLIGGTAFALNTITANATDTIAVHGGGTYLSYNGQTETPILQMYLPAGKYVLTVAGDLVNWGPSDYTRCQIVVNGNQIAATTAVVGDSNQQGSVGPSDLLSSVTLIGGVSTTGGYATFQCEHDYTNGAQPYFDNVGSMWAHKTTSLIVGQG